MAVEAMKQGARVGPYELLSPLGAGGMGEVWKARDTRLDRTVAIKFSKAAFSDRFQREARAIAALNHPNIATLFDVGPDYLVMEYVEGAPIQPTDDIRMLLDLAAQIADGLAAAHAAGIVHRDLKPDNILLTKQRRVKILDFGLAKQAAKPGQDEATMTVATDSGTVMGTVAYMSPEQARGLELDARSDQFCFGLILYELATGKRAFQRPTAAETMTAILRDEAPSLPDTLPTPFRWIVERLLSKDPIARYHSSSDLLIDLRAVTGRLTERVNSAPAPPRPRRLSPWIATGLGLALLAMLFRIALKPPALDASRYRFTPFAVAGGVNEVLPAWSPDGRSIAYVEADGEDRRLMIKAVVGGAPLTLVRTKRYLGSISWSADGERIYYYDRATPLGHVAWVSRAGGQPTVLRFEGVREGAGFGTPAMSPDGRTLALLAAEEAGGKRVRRLALSSPPGSAPRLIGPELPCCVVPTCLAWSPDSARLIGQIPDEGSLRHLWLFPVDGNARIIPTGPARTQPTGSILPGGRYAVLSTVSASLTDQGLQLLDVETGALSPLLPSPVPLLDPAVSLDGKRIAYVAQTHGFALLEIPLDGTPPHPLFPANVDQHSAAWAPAGGGIVLARAESLVIRDAGGSERVLVSPRDFPEAEAPPVFTWPEFSPDGLKVIFTCRGCEPGLSLWMIPAGGGTPARVARGTGDGGYGASWSPDGQWVAYNNTRAGQQTSLSRLRVGSDAGPQKLADHSCFDLAWSPEGKRIACAQPGRLDLISPDGKERRALNGDGIVGPVAWSRNGRELYVVRRQGERVRLERVDADSGTTRPVNELPSSFQPRSPVATAGLSVSASGGSLAISVLDQDGDIWILDGFKPPKSFWERLWLWKR
jgi:Tol biopolymer transport system component/predicted Ser/Thr protein kinase